jgi:tRNA A-37 threonylcarbamoyl transferase component Bud32
LNGARLRSAGLFWRVADDERGRFPGAYGPLFDALAGDLSGVEALRRTQRKKVFRQPAPGDPASHAYLKVYDRRGIGTFLSPPALREARGMQRLASLGIVVPRVVAVGVSPLSALRERSALLSVTPARFRHFGAHAHRVLDLAHGSRAELLEDLGRLHELLRRMHDAGFFHGDLNLGNVLFDPGAREFCFIDFHRSASAVLRKARERSADLSKLREFFAGHVPWPEWEPLIRKAYCAGDAKLADLVLADWEAVRRERAARKIAGTVKNARAGEHHFARRDVGAARVTFSRQAGLEPEALVALAKSGGGGRVCRLGVYEDARHAREAWIEAVRRAASGEPGPLPLACVELDGRGVLLGLEGEEPRYSLRRVFSLRRFAEPEPAGCQG